MKRIARNSTTGSALVVSLSTVLVLTIVGAGVLANVTTRYNVSTSQVRAWKQALHAAEAAGDIAYAAVRKLALEGLKEDEAFAGWTKDGRTYTSPATTIGGNLVATATVDWLENDSITGNAWYRIRAKGTAPIQGMKRTGMDDRMGVNARGADTLLRKIDLNYDHFIAAYGPNGDGIDKQVVPVAYPQVTRRIELIAAPITPFEAAIKANGTFYGLGSAAQIDSYSSKNGANPSLGIPYGPYPVGASSLKSHPYHADSQSGHVQIGSSVATLLGTVYGNVATNGGTIVRNSSQVISGTIDNNVPFALEPYKMPPMPTAQVSPTTASGTTTLSLPGAGEPSAPIYYLFSSYGSGDKVTVEPYSKVVNGVTVTYPTYVAIRVTSDFEGTITVRPNVQVQIYFDGNLKLKADKIINQTGFAGNLQFYGISPTAAGATQSISIDPPGSFSAVIYAPSADYKMNGNPDIIGALVCKSFYGNGNTSWHYDRELDYLGEVIDYRIASYVEDIR